MFFTASKIFYFLFSPICWILLCFVLGLLLKNVSKKKKFIFTGLALLILFTNPFIFNIVMHLWEVPSQRMDSINEPYDVGVLMGGAMRYYNSEMDRVVYGSGADRLMQCIYLYKKGKIKKILISGGSGLLIEQRYKEADLLQNVLISANIPKHDIHTENKSKNTYENALFSAVILKKDFSEKRILVVTSAYHMRRSLACFRKQGIIANAFCVDEMSGKKQYTPDKLIIPGAFYLEGWDKLIHEWAGYVSYMIAGYI